MRVMPKLGRNRTNSNSSNGSRSSLVSNNTIPSSSPPEHLPSIDNDDGIENSTIGTSTSGFSSASSSPGTLYVHQNGLDLKTTENHSTAVSGAGNRPGTPPKKSWERHYNSFLSQVGHFHQHSNTNSAQTGSDQFMPGAAHGSTSATSISSSDDRLEETTLGTKYQIISHDRGSELDKSFRQAYISNSLLNGSKHDKGSSESLDVYAAANLNGTLASKSQRKEYAHQYSIQDNNNTSDYDHYSHPSSPLSKGTLQCPSSLPSNYFPTSSNHIHQSSKGIVTIGDSKYLASHPPLLDPSSNDSSCYAPPLLNRSISEDPHHKTRNNLQLMGKNNSDNYSNSKSQVTTTFDSTVHGGKLFKSFFPKRNSHRPAESLDISSKNSNRRAMSLGSLDATMRRGADVACSVTGSSGADKNMSLDGSKRGSKSKEMKHMFTQFHNSHNFGRDSVSPYLGDEKSIRRGNYFTMLRQPSQTISLSDSITRRISGGNLGSSAPLASVTEDVIIHPSRILYPIESVENLTENQKYWIAPAILSYCSHKVYSLMSTAEQNADVNKEHNDEDASDGHWYDRPSITHDDAKHENLTHGKIVLGKAIVAEFGNLKSSFSGFGWAVGIFVLRQNYLLEFEEGDNLNGRPRRFAHLEHAQIQPHEDFDDALELLCYQYPRRRGLMKKLLMRLDSEAERDRWVSYLVQAAKLTIEDLYEYDPSSDGAVLGRGRFAFVYPGRRRRGRRCSTRSSAYNNNDGGKTGIMKKNPSFTSLSNTLNSKLSLNENECALKIIDKKVFWKRVKEGNERSDTIVRETAVQATLTAEGNSLPTFLQIRSFFETSDKVVLELELLEGIDLFRYVSSKGILDEVEAAHIMRDILTCLDQMNRIGIAHRDVKPANILMANKSKDDGVYVKLGDFGMATFVGVDNLVRGRCGTSGYVAPEILAAKTNGGYENKVDTFSAGVTLYILLCGYEPFYGESEKELIQANKEAKVEYPECDWSSISVEGRDLVERMLEPDPKKRIEAVECLRHPWITRRANPSPCVEKTEMLNNPNGFEDAACIIS